MPDTAISHPDEAAGLVAAIRAVDLSAPGTIVRNFVERYRD